MRVFTESISRIGRAISLLKYGRGLSCQATGLLRTIQFQQTVSYLQFEFGQQDWVIYIMLFQAIACLVKTLECRTKIPLYVVNIRQPHLYVCNQTGFL